MGSSMGAYLAALHAAREPETCPPLVLMGPGVRFRAPLVAAPHPRRKMENWKASGSLEVYHYGTQRREKVGYRLYAEALTQRSVSRGFAKNACLPRPRRPGCRSAVIGRICPGQTQRRIGVARFRSPVARRDCYRMAARCGVLSWIVNPFAPPGRNRRQGTAAAARTVFVESMEAVSRELVTRRSRTKRLSPPSSKGTSRWCTAWPTISSRIGRWRRIIAQEAYLELYRNLTKLESDVHLSNWLRQTVTRKCIDYKRRQKHRRYRPLEEVREPGFHDVRRDPILADALGQRVAALPKRCAWC